MNVSINETVTVGDGLPFVLFGGLNVLGDVDSTLLAHENCTWVTRKQRVPYVFKAPLDQASRSSTKPFRDVGI